MNTALATGEGVAALIAGEARAAEKQRAVAHYTAMAAVAHYEAMAATLDALIADPNLDPRFRVGLPVLRPHLVEKREQLGDDVKRDAARAEFEA